MNFANSEVRVLFLIHVPTNDPIAECLALTGSDKAMGSWNTDDAIVAEYVGAATWQVALNLPRDETIQWKWLLLSREAKEVLKWEEGPNRVLSTLDDDLSVESFWNGQEMITALYSDGRRKARKMERRALEQCALWSSSEAGDAKITKKDRRANPWNRNNSYHSLHSSESDKNQTRRSRSVSHLKVRFADGTSPDNSESKHKQSFRDCLQISTLNFRKSFYPAKDSCVDHTKTAVINWKKIADFSIPVGLVTGAAALGIFIFRKLS